MGSLLLNQGLNLHPLHWKVESSKFRLILSSWYIQAFSSCDTQASQCGGSEVASLVAEHGL